MNKYPHSLIHTMDSYRTEQTRFWLITFQSGKPFSNGEFNSFDKALDYAKKYSCFDVHQHTTIYDSLNDTHIWLDGFLQKKNFVNRDEMFTWFENHWLYEKHDSKSVVYKSAENDYIARIYFEDNRVEFEKIENN